MRCIVRGNEMWELPEGKPSDEVLHEAGNCMDSTYEVRSRVITICVGTEEKQGAK